MAAWREGARRRGGLRLGRDNGRIFWAVLLDEGANGLVWGFLAIYVAALGGTSPQVGLVLGVIGAAQLLALLPSGWLAGHVGARRVVLGGRSLTLVGLVLLGLSERWWEVAVGGIVLVCGAVAWPAVSTAIAGNARDDADRTRAFTLCYTVGPSVALLLTPAAGGYLADAVALRAVFFAAIALRIVAIVTMASVHWPPHRPEGRRSARPPAATGSAAANSYRAALRQRPIRLLALLQLGTIFCLALGWCLAPNYLRDVHDVSLGTIGRLGSLTALGSIVLGLLAGRLPRLRRPLAAVALAVATMAGAFILLLIGGGPVAFALAYTLGGGYAVAWSLFYPAYGEVTPARFRTRAYALAELAPVLGKTLAPFVAG
jgi:DHA1 family bicyclomycin/chloramphenicol resistance-like MFS transporter